MSTQGKLNHPQAAILEVLTAADRVDPMFSGAVRAALNSDDHYVMRATSV